MFELKIDRGSYVIWSFRRVSLLCFFSSEIVPIGINEFVNPIDSPFARVPFLLELYRYSNSGAPLQPLEEVLSVQLLDT